MSRAALATGVRVAYASAGAVGGRPVLLLHAWGESRGDFDRLLPLLPPDVWALAMDQRGHGASEAPAAGYGLTDGSADVQAFMDAVGIPSAVLVGSSSGGYLAQQVAVDAPARVQALVLVGSPRTLQGRPAFAQEIEQLGDPVDPQWVRAFLDWFPRFRAVPQWYVEDRVQDGARIPASVWRASLAGLSSARPPTDTGTITAPTLIVGGARDTLLTPEHQQSLVAAIPGSRLVTYAHTGHLVLWEQPERLAADLSSFLGTVPSDG